MSGEQGLSTINQLILALIAFIGIAGVVYFVFPGVFDNLMVYMRSAMEFLLAMAGIVVRGCEGSSVDSINALAAALDCEAYIHTHERCVELPDPCIPGVMNPDSCTYPRFEYGDTDTFNGANTDNVLNNLPKDLKKINFMIKKRHKENVWGDSEDKWKLERFEVFNIDKSDVKHKILEATPDKWLKPDTPAESYLPWDAKINYDGVGINDRTTKYEIVVKTKDEGILAGTGTDDTVYFCFSNLDSTDTTGKYQKCTAEQKFGDSKVKCDGSPMNVTCKVDNFKIEQRENILSTQQPDCVVYYGAFPPGEEVYWQPDMHKYDWAYIAISGGFGALSSMSFGTAKAGKELVYASARESPGAVKSLFSFLGKKIESKLGMKTSSEATEVSLFKVVQQSIRKSTPEANIEKINQMAPDLESMIPIRPAGDEIGSELFDDIEDRMYREIKDQWELNEEQFLVKDSEVVADLEFELPREIARAMGLRGLDPVDSSKVIELVKNGDEDYFKKVISDIGAALSGARNVAKYGNSFDRFLVKWSIFMDSIEKPASFATTREYRDYLNQKTYDALKNMNRDNWKRGKLYMATMAEGCSKSYSCREGIIRMMGTDVGINDTIFNMLEDSTGMDKDYAESWGKCLAAPELGGTLRAKGFSKGFCLLAATIGIEVLQKYSKLQIFSPVGMNALGYYKPYEDKATAVHLQDDTNYFYVELDKKNLEDLRFHLASPCSGNLVIRHERCECNTGDTQGSGPNYPNYFIDTQKKADGAFKAGKIPSLYTEENRPGDSIKDTYSEIYSYRIAGESADCIINISKINDACIEASKSTIVPPVCTQVKIAHDLIGQAITANDMVCEDVKDASANRLYIPQLYFEIARGLWIARPDYCGSITDYPGSKPPKDCWTDAQLRNVYYKVDDKTVPASIGAYIDKQPAGIFGWLGFDQTNMIFYSQFPMIYTGKEDKYAPEDYLLKDSTGNPVITADKPLDAGWSNNVPVRMSDFSSMKYMNQDDKKLVPLSEKPDYYQAREADISVLKKIKTPSDPLEIPIIYSGPAGGGVKECLSLEDAKKKWNHPGRKGLEVDCLKVSVEPNPAWSGNGNNYCYHDISDQESKAQWVNMFGWMAVEWGATYAVSTVTTPAGGLAAKPAIGLVTGVASEYTSQYIQNVCKQQWPGHPENCVF